MLAQLTASTDVPKTLIVWAMMRGHSVQMPVR